MDTKLLDYFSGNELSAAVWKSKYADIGEETPDDMHRRLAREFASATDLYSEKEIYEAFKDFKYIVGQGSVMAVIGTNKIASASNCFILGQPHDSYGGILLFDQRLVQLMKRRGGVGLDISTLRPAMVPVNNAAVSSTGAVSFMDRFSNSTREVAQGGRRGALMITMSINHPDSGDFIRAKQDLTKITGANVSLLIPDAFMQAVKRDTDYVLRWPCDTKITPEIREYIFSEGWVRDTLIEYDGKYFKVVRAKELYQELVKNAWANAEPGQLFIDKHWQNSPDTVYPKYKAVTCNPCAEIMTQEGDSCRLIALNYFGFVDNPFTPEASFNLIKLRKYAYMQQVLADALVDLEIKQIDKILTKIDNDEAPEHIKAAERDLWIMIKNAAMDGRRTGCGFTALGDAIAALNLPYDSEEAKALIEAIQNVKMDAELEATIELAKRKGPFKGWRHELEYVTDADGNTVGANDFYELIRTEFPARYREMAMFGRRNVSWSTVAPTGSVSILTQTTSGLEPVYKVLYTRRVKINPGGNQRVDFVDQNGDKWTEYPVLHPKFKDWLTLQNVEGRYNVASVDGLSIDSLTELYKESPWFLSEADDIDWLGRVEIQSIIQKYTSHSISSTVNLPASATEEDVFKIYMEAWDRNLKGITVYRDGSRTGVLVSSTTKEEEFREHDAPKRPKQLKGELHHSVSLGIKWTFSVGLMNGKPYELFATPGHFGLNGQAGTLEKHSRGNYAFYVNDEVVIANVLNGLKDEEEALTRLISTSLRHGAALDFVSEQLSKTNGAVVSFSKAAARVLRKYSSKTHDITCQSCGSTEVVRSEGCSTCQACGSSKCG